MRIRSLLVVALVATIAATAGACGTDEQAERERTAAKQRAEQQQREFERERREWTVKLREARQQADSCQEKMKSLIDELGELNSRLDIGLTYSDYSDRVSDVNVVYDEIDWDDAGEDPSVFECVSRVGLPAEQALNEYAKATRSWGRCMDDFDCDTDSIQPALQRRWSKAADKADTAEEALDDMQDEVERLEDEEPLAPDTPTSTGRTVTT